jgi:hypothetical protein
VPTNLWDRTLALACDPSTPAGQLTWRPADKKQLVDAGYGTLNQLPLPILDPVKKLYVSTIEVRHALIHRKIEVAADGALVGHTNSGTPLRPVTVEQQTRMCELAQWLAQAIEKGLMTAREQRRVIGLLAVLAPLHGQNIAHAPVLGDVKLVKYALDASYQLDLAGIRARAGAAFGMDLQLQTEGGTFLSGEIDDVPTNTIIVDLKNLPPWLRVTHPGADMPSS